MTTPVPTIDASPTKEFFISMLVRDVKLVRAIIDLIDNCVDGALRQAHEDFSPFHIRLSISPTIFQIQDNCGGMSVDIAKNYAFRFGRTADATATDGSIGQFGVGMKRTIFKLGRKFDIKSATPTSRFEISEDVDDWLQRKDDWHFTFSSLDEDVSVADEDVGTTVEITRLHDNVRDDFGRDTFIAELKAAIEEAHALRLQQKLSITVNGTPLGVEEFKLLKSDLLTPAYSKIEIPATEGKKHGVTVQIYAGLSERSFEKGGWYIFCNGRQVLAANQDATTGWDSVVEAELSEEKEETMRKYHADFAFFRGFVFFDSADASLLPWTTTKTGVDTDSPIFRAAKREMQRMMRPVIRFLSELARETSDKNKDSDTDTPLRDALFSAPAVSYTQLQLSSSFVSTVPKRRTRKMDIPYVNIQYRKDRSIVEVVKKRLGASTASEAGEMTFDYFFKAECQ